MASPAGSQADSPWSWFVLACCFLCSLFFSLLGTSVGMVQVEMINDLQLGSGVISIMTSCATGFNTLLGPLSGLIASIITLRLTIILGTILMSLGMLLTAFSYSLPTLLLFYGILTGVGFGIAFTPCIVIIQSYFDKKLILANGIMTSAASCGLLSLPYLHRYIIEEYGWRFCFALNAALILHIIVFASFFKPSPAEKMGLIRLNCFSRQGDASKNGSECDSNYLDKDKESSDEEETANVGDSLVVKPEEKLFLSKDSIFSHEYSKKINMLIRSTDNISLGSRGLPASGKALPYIPVYINGTPKLRSPVSDFIVANSPSLRRSLISVDGDTAKNVFSGSISQISSVSIQSLDSHPITATAGISGIASTSTLKPHKFGQLRKGSKGHLGSSLAFASTDLGSSIMLPIAIEEIKTPDDIMEDESLSTKMKRIVGCKFLWLMCVNALFFMCGCGTHSVHLPSYVVSKGIAMDRVADVYLTFGITITVARLGGGALYNRIKPPLIILLFVLQFLNGLILLMAPWFATEMSGIVVLEIGLGIVYGQGYMIQAPVLTQMIRVQDLSIAFGFVQIFNGLGFISAPILAGFLYDVTGTFDIPLHIAGSVVMAGSFLLLWIQYRNHKDKLANKSEDVESATNTSALMEGDQQTN